MANHTEMLRIATSLEKICDVLEGLAERQPIATIPLEPPPEECEHSWVSYVDPRNFKAGHQCTKCAGVRNQRDIL